MKIKRNLYHIFYLIILSCYLLISAGYSDTLNSNTYILKITPLNKQGLTKFSALNRSNNTRTKLEMVSQTSSSDKPPRQRNPELSEELLVVKGINKKGIEIMRTLIQDPRIVRAESVDDYGTVTPTKFLQNDVEFPVSLPINSQLSTIEIHHPHWNGERYVLQLQGKLKIDK